MYNLTFGDDTNVWFSNYSLKELISDFYQFNKNALVLIRGLPGSGKSTLAKELAIKHNFVHFEADMFFEIDDNYIFDKSKLSQAHEWCFNQTINALSKSNSVCVANTFVKKWEMQRYIDSAKDFNAKLIIIECLSQYNSIHSVPKETIEKMKRQWENI